MERDRIEHQPGQKQSAFLCPTEYEVYPELILSNPLASWSRKQLIRNAEDHLIKYYDIRKKGSWQLFF